MGVSVHAGEVCTEQIVNPGLLIGHRVVAACRGVWGHEVALFSRVVGNIVELPRVITERVIVAIAIASAAIDPVDQLVSERVALQLRCSSGSLEVDGSTAPLACAVVAWVHQLMPSMS